MSETEVPVSLKFEVEEGGASEALKKLAEGAEVLAEHINKASEALTDVLGLAGLLAGAFSFEKLIESTTEHITAVEKLADQTGIAAEQADGLLESFNRYGVSAESATNIVGRMSKQMLQLTEASTGVSGSATQIYQEFARLHVDLRQGVVPSIMQMAERSKDGKLSIQDLARGMRLSTESAIQFSKFLKQGPESIRETMEELQKTGTAINEMDRKHIDAFKMAKADMGAAFERIGIVVGTKILPVLTKLMEVVTEHVRAWMPAVQKFGDFVVSHMETAVTLATTLGKILLANAVLQKVGAGGLTGVGSTALSLGRSAIGAGATSGIGALGGWLSQGGGAMGALGSAMSIAASAAALASVAAIVGVIAGGIYGIVTNFKGVTDFMMESFDRLRDAASVLGDALAGLFGSGTPGGVILDAFEVALPLALTTVFDGLTSVISEMLVLGKVIGYVIDRIHSGHADQLLDPENLSNAWKGAEIDVQADMEEAAAARAAAKKQAGDRAAAGAPVTNQDFRGSHFTIDQQFAEGYEPDRILTAFTHDLAGLGERAGQSPFAANGAIGRAGG